MHWTLELEFLTMSVNILILMQHWIAIGMTGKQEISKLVSKKLTITEDSGLNHVKLLRLGILNYIQSATTTWVQTFNTILKIFQQLFKKTFDVDILWRRIWLLWVEIGSYSSLCPSCPWLSDSKLKHIKYFQRCTLHPGRPLGCKTVSP